MEMNETNEMNPTMGIMKKDREKLPWSEEVWSRIDQAVYDECKRTKVAAKFLPLHGPLSSGTMTVPSDTILSNGFGAPAPGDKNILSIDEGAMRPLVELITEFTLTPQQVEREEWLGTAVTLATRAANQLSQAEDVIIFQGQSAVDGIDGPRHPLFSSGKVSTRSGPANRGLVNTPLLPIQEIDVAPIQPPEPIRRWGENTFGAVAAAYSRLQSGDDGLNQAHYGPYALVLHHVPYADTYAPLPTTLIMPGDRIKELVPEHFYGTGTIPPTGIDPPFCGIFVSLGGNTMDLAVGMDATTEFLQEDTEGRFRFRVYERFSFRLKDESARIKLNFVNGAAEPVSKTRKR